MASISSFFSKAVAAVAIGGCLIFTASCETCRPSQKTVVAQKQSSSRYIVSKNGTEVADRRYLAAAEREVVRRKEQVRQADEIALQASKMEADGDLQGAVDGYRRAIDMLPN